MLDTGGGGGVGERVEEEEEARQWNQTALHYPTNLVKPATLARPDREKERGCMSVRLSQSVRVSAGMYKSGLGFLGIARQCLCILGLRPKPETLHL